MNRRQPNKAAKSNPSKLTSLLLNGGNGVISLVGAGGKTSLMFRLAGEAPILGQPLITTTTTRILLPTMIQSSKVLLANTTEEILNKLTDSYQRYPHVTVAAKKSPQGTKLIGLGPGEVDALSQSKKVSWILVEADGAAKKPLKAPAGHEPVIPRSSTLVVGVIGLKAIGKPLIEKWVFRSALFAKITGISLGDPVSVDALAKLINHPHGLFKRAPACARCLVFLNLAGDDGLLQYGLTLVERLKNLSGQKQLTGVIIGHGRDKPGLVAYHHLP